MATITASLSTRVDARGKSELLLRFVGGRDHIYRLHSKLFIPPARWKDGAIVIPRLETPEQRELLAVRKDLEDLIDFLLTEFARADQSRVTREWMQEAVERYHHPEHGEDEGLVGLFFEFVRKRDLCENRRQHYEVVGRSLERFEAFSGVELTAGGLDYRTLEKYADFLAKEHEIARQRKWRSLYRDYTPEKRGKNVIIGYMKTFRTFYRSMNRQGITGNDPFARYEIGTAVYGTPYYITIEERDQLYRTNLRRHPALAAQRDIFVFQCLVGCRVGDLIALKKEDIHDGVLVYIPRKTIDNRPVVVRVPLNGTAAEIVARYAGMPGNKLLPFISQPKYNEAIKRCFLAARLNRPVAVLNPLTRKEEKKPLHEVASSHLARRTFIGNLYKQVKDPNLISSMSGHTEGSRAFARYRDIDDEMKAGLVEMLERKK